MPRVNFVKKAQKNNPAVNKGESYYWWKFRYGRKHYSKTSPKRSQLTQSDFLSQMYDIEDQLSEISGEDREDLCSQTEEITEEIRQLGEEQQEKLYNMPEQLQESSPAGETLQNRIEMCEEMVSELESIVFDDEDQAIEDLIDEIQNISYQGE